MYPWTHKKKHTHATSILSVSARRIKPSCHNCAYRERLTHWCTKRSMDVVDHHGNPYFPNGCSYWVEHTAQLSEPDGERILAERRVKHRGATTGAYRCATCGALIGRERAVVGGQPKCPYCKGRILIKVRQPVVRTVKAV